MIQKLKRKMIFTQRASSRQIIRSSREKAKEVYKSTAEQAICRAIRISLVLASTRLTYKDQNSEVPHTLSLSFSVALLRLQPFQRVNQDSLPLSFSPSHSPVSTNHVEGDGKGANQNTIYTTSVYSATKFTNICRFLSLLSLFSVLICPCRVCWKFLSEPKPCPAVSGTS